LKKIATFNKTITMGNLLEGTKKTISNIVDTTENRLAEGMKKKWCKPFFEIISKEVVKGGTGSSAESNHAYS
jgi:hypothetical protein